MMTIIFTLLLVIAHVADASSKTTPPTTYKKRLTEETVNPNIRTMEYAVRGEVVIAANKIAEELASNEEGKKKNNRSYDKIVYTNIGNPQSVGQKPLTWPRQVMALMDLPDEVGIDHPDVSRIFPADAIARAREIKSKLSVGSSGAYSHSKGNRLFRDDVVHFLKQRDGPEVPTDPELVFLNNGASESISNVLTTMIGDPSIGIMIPIPQYPIYSATIDRLGGTKVGYYLDEANQWDLDIKELERSLREARSKGTNVVALTIINPGNPTGSVLSKKTVQDVVRFCSQNNLVLLADEVYQENVYSEGEEFYSCKRAAYDLGFLEPSEESIELASFHSTSKGVFGECGRRGGYMELTGFDPLVVDQIYKLASTALCSSLNGQCMTGLMCHGPQPGDESYKSHEAEKAAIFESLKRRAKIVGEGLDSIEGFSCQPAKGSMYCFPSVQIPEGAIEEAQQKGTTPDTLYALSLLERTGICVVPASGFVKIPGRFGFRTTFLPPEADMARSVTAMKTHHEEFCARYK